MIAVLMFKENKNNPPHSSVDNYEGDYSYLMCEHVNYVGNSVLWE